MIIELYAAPLYDGSESISSPVSNPTGELPDQEPSLDLGDLLGSFDSQAEAITFVTNQFTTNDQSVTDSRVISFNAYTHIELLTVTVQNGDQSTQDKNYYLVTDEGY